MAKVERNINCTTPGDFTSCNISDNPYGVWKEKPFPDQGQIIKGKYRLSQVKSGYKTGNQQYCMYSIYDEKQVWKAIFLFLKADGGNFDTKFIAFFDTQFLWNVRGGFDNSAFCEPLNPGELIDTKSCPMIEQPEILYLPPDTNDTSGFYWGTNYNLVNLDYNTLLSICGATTVCKINIGNSYLEYINQNYGEVTINTLQPNIVTISNIETDPESPCELKKKEPFNTIYCKPKRK